jgi:hypothetical protein
VSYLYWPAEVSTGSPEQSIEELLGSWWSRFLQIDERMTSIREIDDRDVMTFEGESGSVSN